MISLEEIKEKYIKLAMEKGISKEDAEIAWELHLELVKKHGLEDEFFV